MELIFNPLITRNNMEMKVLTKNGKSALSVKANFYEVLDKNLAAVCDAIANKGIILKELLKLFEKCDDEFLEVVLLTPVGIRGKKETVQSLSEGLEISFVTAQYLLNTPFDDLTDLNAQKLDRMLDDYNENIRKLVV